MLYWLAGLSDTISAFNVFRYITFRTGGAVVTALLVVFLFGPKIRLAGAAALTLAEVFLRCPGRPVVPSRSRDRAWCLPGRLFH